MQTCLRVFVRAHNKGLHANLPQCSCQSTQQGLACKPASEFLSGHTTWACMQTCLRAFVRAHNMGLHANLPKSFCQSTQQGLACKPASFFFGRAHSKGLPANLPQFFLAEHTTQLACRVSSIALISTAGILLQINNNIFSTFHNSIDDYVTLNASNNCFGNEHMVYIKKMALEAIEEPIPHHRSGIACITQASNNSVYRVSKSCRQNLMLHVT